MDNSFFLLICLQLLSFVTTAAAADVATSIGAIVDLGGSRIGKEAKAAMEIAVEDFYNQTNQTVILQVKNNSRTETAMAAKHLIHTQKVESILGVETWEETSIVAEICSRWHIPFLSLAADENTPPWATTRWPFLVQASPSQHGQMKAIASIVQSWKWRRVVVIYEDNPSYSAGSGITPHLYDALREVGSEISLLVPLPPFASSSYLSQELKRILNQDCRVFVVHASLELSVHIFRHANKMGMMEKGHVWITTESTTNFVHFLNPSEISNMKGILGVKSHFPEESNRVQDFYAKFRRKFGSEHPEEENRDPSIFSLRAYDATWAVGLATLSQKGGRHNLMEKILQNEFDGLSGKIKFTDRKISPARIYEIINVFGKSYGELGFWSEGMGFSETIDEAASYNNSMENLGQVVWPGRPWFIPRGWAIPSIVKPLRVGVPSGSLLQHYVKVEHIPKTKNYSITGFAIDVFHATVKRLPYHLSCQFFPFAGTYVDLVQQIQLKRLDAVVGDIAIVSSRYRYAEYTLPYTESGVVMVVPVQDHHRSREWIFIKPFTKAMWILTASINVYNSFVIWMIERNYCSELKGSIVNQIGTLLWLAFATLFSLQGKKLHSNMSRIATVVWLFVAVVIMQSYTANFTSMLTVHKLEPKIADIEKLKNSNAFVGYSRRTFVAKYLVDVLGFNRRYIKNFSAFDEFAGALKTGEIAAIFLEVPTAKLFLAKYCKSFIIAGPTYKIGGYGFAFPKGSPLVADFNEALLEILESGVIRELEKRLIESEKCVEMEPDQENASLSPNSFWVLFMLTGGTSTAALALFVFKRSKCRPAAAIKEPAAAYFFQFKTSIWILILMIFLRLRQSLHRRRLFRRLISLDRNNSPPNATSDSSSSSSHVSLTINQR